MRIFNNVWGRFFATLVMLFLFLALLELSLNRQALSAGLESHNQGRTKDEEQTIRVYRNTKDAVVFITTVALTFDPFDIFSGIKREAGTGSGVIVDAERGLVLTNLHVIRDAANIHITLFDGRDYTAKLVGVDDDYDLAILRLNSPPREITAVVLADSAQVEVGQKVLAIGNPFGLNNTLTTGIVSSLDRTVRNPSGPLMRGLIQTDASINPGNSGGPLLDSSGQMIGINTAILSRSGDSAGIGFAIPSNYIKRILPDLLAHGKVLRPEVGWILADTNQGPMVRRVMEGSPAARAGVEPFERAVQDAFVRGYIRDLSRGDLIYKINGKRSGSLDDVDQIIKQNEGNKPLEVELRRGGIYGKARKVMIKPVLR